MSRSSTSTCFVTVSGGHGFSLKQENRTMEEKSKETKRKEENGKKPQQ
jgi:hypothetical protein